MDATSVHTLYIIVIYVQVRDDQILAILKEQD